MHSGSLIQVTGVSIQTENELEKGKKNEPNMQENQDIPNLLNILKKLTQGLT